MRLEFIKMHGLGNDFVVLDARAQSVPELDAKIARAIADRKTGIGCDQLIVLRPSQSADFAMLIYNADGGEVEACGNATRAVGLLHGGPASIETAGGLLHTKPSENGVTVDMGEPRLEWDQIPLAYPMDTLTMPLAWPYDEAALEQPSAVNVGNPHAVFFVDNCDGVPLETLGPIIENDDVFPDRVNVNVATIVDRETIRLRVWERGVGETRACGTGACATAIAAMRRKLTGREVSVELAGGSLSIVWGEDNRITMSGPAEESFRGSFDWSSFA